MTALRAARRIVLCGLVGLAAGLLVSPPAAAAGPTGSWVWPVDGGRDVLRPFAPPEQRYGAGHRGVDLAAGTGRVVAAGPGRVSYAGLLAGRGVVVVVHGELRTTYEPVSPAVRVDQQVAAGTLLGVVQGSHAGCPTACLHWGLLRGQTYLDPLSLVRRGPSRLLPVPAPAVVGAPVPVPAPAAAERLQPVSEPRWALRSGRDGGAGAGALLALLLGLALLVRRAAPAPRPPPDTPAPAAGDRTAPRAPDPPAPPAAAVLDLGVERARRRA